MAPESWEVPAGDDAGSSLPETPDGSYPYPPPPPPANAGRRWTIAGLVCAILALGLLPIILGPMGAVFGFMGNSRGDPNGRLVGIAAICTTVAGIIIGAVVYNAQNP